ncbi:hypothetical protein ACIQC9_00800 [Brevundimonas sp. NPDC092305]|uniref:hypothetical protein n=1 Tax=Brevundimonas sp. NPDC092305 TaxID=3363957 RepID=UPI00381BBD9D
MIRSATLCAAALSLATAGVASAQAERGAIYQTAPAMNATLANRVTPQMDALLDRLIVDGREMELDGVRVFEANDKFLPGKIAIGLAHAILSAPEGDPRRERYLAGFRRLADLTLEDENETWGIYYYVSALHQLHDAGLLDQAVSAPTLARLRERLDWRGFVRQDDLTLINLPNNYYGVAFSIARLRFLLGWEDASGSEALLARTLDHFRRYSGEYGFADETDGEGRFDRYSVLLIGEIAQRFIETGVEPPPEVRTWLRRSVDLLLPRFNLRGEGFEYGRSIGTYGETAFLEVLTAAAALDILTDEEERMAYAFSSRITARYADFWLDSGTGSVNLWDHGRKTDAYRGKHRILGENLSLSHQLYYTNALWNRAGYQDQAPDAGFAHWLGGLPRSTVTWFSRGEFDRLLVTWRDGDRLVGLPLINGGPGQHMNNPYYPAPFSPGVLSGSADATFPQLVPRLTLADGAVLQPLSWFRDVRVDEQADGVVVEYRQDEMDLMGENAPRRDARAAASTRFELRTKSVERSDVITLAAGQTGADVDLEFATFSYGAQAGPDGIRFAGGEVERFTAVGLTCRAVEPDAPAYRTPVGPYATVVRCTGRITGAEGRIGWRLAFRS